MKKIWFWGTFFFLVFFTGSIFSWALIFSPIHFEPKTIEKFETEFNGSIQKNQIWVNDGRLKNLLPVIARKWKEEGWISYANGLDFTSSLLGEVGDTGTIPENLRLNIFRKKGFFKTLGLWEPLNESKTYGWESEVPDSAFNPDRAKAHWTFPFIPPPNTSRLYCQKLKNFQIAFISFPPRENLVAFFQQLCASQGFSLRLWSQDDGQKVYVLFKNNRRLLAVLNSEEGRDSLSLVSLNKRL
jgi:hypothetical protein